MHCGPTTVDAQRPAGSQDATGGAVLAGSHRRPGVLREVLLIVVLFLVYRLVRLAITGHDTLAVENAWWVWAVERALWLPDEEALQDWFIQWPDLLRAANWYYVGVHFPLTAAFLAWGWWRRAPADYRWARRLITVLTGLALIGHVLMPLAPPRMLRSLGFLDTMATYGPSAYSGSAATVANQFAAMPSLHVGWALLIAVVVVHTARSPWRWLTLAHPALTLAVVVVTANHFWVDALVAALLLGVALAITPAPGGQVPAARWARGVSGAWATDRSAQAMTIRRTRSDVGAGEPPAGSIVSPRPSADPMSSTSASSTPPRPRTATD